MPRHELVPPDTSISSELAKDSNAETGQLDIHSLVILMDQNAGHIAQIPVIVYGELVIHLIAQKEPPLQ